MGTNYYLHDEQKCPCCGRESDPRHIGKSSHGWCFALHVIPEEGINDLEDWEKLLAVPGVIIKDEYDREISVESIMGIITKRSYDISVYKEYAIGSSPYRNMEEYHYSNDSMIGPSGLCRSKLNSRCIKHGNGTWDCIVGEFS